MCIPQNRNWHNDIIINSIISRIKFRNGIVIKIKFYLLLYADEGFGFIKLIWLQKRSSIIYRFIYAWGIYIVRGLPGHPFIKMVKYTLYPVAFCRHTVIRLEIPNRFILSIGIHIASGSVTEGTFFWLCAQ